MVCFDVSSTGMPRLLDRLVIGLGSSYSSNTIGEKRGAREASLLIEGCPEASLCGLSEEEGLDSIYSG